MDGHDPVQYKKMAHPIESTRFQSKSSSWLMVELLDVLQRSNTVNA